MTGDSSFSHTQDDELSPDPNLHITIEEVSQHSETLLGDEGSELENGREELFEIDGNGKTDQYLDMASNGHEEEDDETEHFFGIEEGNSRGEDETNEPFFDLEDDIKDDQGRGDFGRKMYPEPAVGTEFETYDEAYDFYNSYARETGFAIRVKSSWTKRNSKEKRGAVLCCNCEGFKTVKEANSRRRETRTGCLAMIRLRLVDPKMWRIDEVKLDHNHSFDPERAQNAKSHKRRDHSGEKRKAEPEIGVEVRTIKLYCTPAAADSFGIGPNPDVVEETGFLRLGAGDAWIISSFFAAKQLTDPDFLYMMDFGEEGRLRNVFWVDSRSRAAYGYFGDVVSFDAACLSRKYEVPLVEFSGVNHHGQSVIFGSGFLADETVESYVWLFRTWLTCLVGRPPQTIITDRCKAVRTAVTEVFPRAHHRLCLSTVVQNILERLRGIREFDAFRAVLISMVYGSQNADEFEPGWVDMIRRFGLGDLEWLRSLYEEDRERWAPVYSKDTFFAGMSSFQKGGLKSSFFRGRVHEKTSYRDFFEAHDLIMEERWCRETEDDFDSREDSSLAPRTRSFYELQVSRLYTKSVSAKFRDEVVSAISRCFDVTQLHVDGSVSTYMVKERESKGVGFEVLFDKAGSEVRCICGCFNLKGYLCRHALCVLSYNGVEEIPFQYILMRWRKDFRRLYVPDLGSSNAVDLTNPVQWFDHLYRRAIQVVEEGMSSQNHYMVAWQAFKESLNKVRLVGDKRV